MKSLLLCLCFCCFVLHGAEDFKSWLDDPELWQKEDAQLAKKFEKSLAWRDQTQKELYCPAKSLTNFSYGDCPVYDLTLKFRENRLNTISFAVFSRGDFKLPSSSAPAAEEGKEKKKKKKTDPAKEAKKRKAAEEEQQKALERRFNTLIAAIKAENKERFKAEPQQSMSFFAGSRKTTLTWKNERTVVNFFIGTGESNKPEYLSLCFSALSPAVKAGKNAAAAEPSSEKTSEAPENAVKPPPSGKKADRANLQKITKEELRACVKSENGVSSIDLPMVDQGSKGYCFPATILRVLHYYRIPMELHELADILDTDPVRGTSVADGVKTLQKIDGRLGVHYCSLYQADFVNPRYAEQFTEHYNQKARRQNLPPMGGFAAPKFYYPIYHEMRANRGLQETFFRKVRQSIAEGLPLLWSVYCFQPQAMSLNKEELPEQKNSEEPEKKKKKSRKERSSQKIKTIPAAEGHLRLIVGYQEKPRAVIYSDSWGKGAEKKTMELDEAWTITTSLFLLKPNR